MPGFYHTTFVKVPASPGDKRRRKPLFGKAYNDADYKVSHVYQGKHLTCPYYSVWLHQLTACYCDFTDRSFCDDWLTFSNFRHWMTLQPWRKGRFFNLGYDTYEPKTCAFLPTGIDKLFMYKNVVGGSRYPQSQRPARCPKPYRANYGLIHLGSFKTLSEASTAYWYYRAQVTQLAHENMLSDFAASGRKKFSENESKIQKALKKQTEFCIEKALFNET